MFCLGDRRWRDIQMRFFLVLLTMMGRLSSPVRKTTPVESGTYIFLKQCSKFSQKVDKISKIKLDFVLFD